MKISFNIKLNNEISSGGMNFSYELISFLKDKGIQIVHSLNDDDIDIIFHINITYCSCYSYYAAFLYKLAHPKTIIIHRVNDSGLQRKNKTMTKRMNKCSYYSDQIIYISDWLQSIMYQRLDESRPFTIIRNGGNSNIFNNVNRLKWDNNSKLKIVTHHYSSNYLKGHEYYQILDKYLNNKSNNDRFEFTYIGNYPKDLNYRNTTIIPVLQGKSLANQLSKHDIY